MESMKEYERGKREQRIIAESIKIEVRGQVFYARRTYPGIGELRDAALNFIGGWSQDTREGVHALGHRSMAEARGEELLPTLRQIIEAELALWR